MNALIIGASAGLGRALTNELAKKGYNLFLVASDQRDLIPLVCDLKIRYKVEVDYCQVQLNKPIEAEELRNRFFQKFDQVNFLFLIAGFGVPSQDFGPISETTVNELISINFASCLNIINVFLPYLENTLNSNIVGIGSIAAIRPREKNAVYASCKRGLEFYFGTLYYYLLHKNCSVQFYRAGYMKTSLLGSQKSFLPAASPEIIAQKIVSNFGKHFQLKYLPRWWYFISLVISILPQTFYKKIKA